MDTEQTTTNEEQGQAADGASRDELLAAVREAGGTASVDIEAEEAAAKARAEAAGTEGEKTEPAKDPDPDEKLNAVLKAREERHAKRMDAESRADRILREAEETKQRLIEEARAEARKAAEEEREKLRLDFRRSPAETLRALGDPNEIVDTVLKADTPEARALAKAQDEIRQAREEAKVGKSAREELADFKKQLAQEKFERHVAEARTAFLSNHAPPEKAPYMHARWDPPEVFARCDALCREWENDGLERGKDFDESTLVQYLEKQSRDRFQKLSPAPAQQVSAGAPAREPGNAPKVSANGSRTLPAAAGSERRTSPRPLHELSPKEAREELIKEVEAARRANPDAKL